MFFFINVTLSSFPYENAHIPFAFLGSIFVLLLPFYLVYRCQYSRLVITHIQTSNKTYEVASPPKQVLSPKIAAGMREILCYNLRNEYGVSPHLSHQYPVKSDFGGKNGHVANGASVSFAGITPTLCGVVWTGGVVSRFSFTNLQMQSKAAAPILYDIMYKAEALSLMPVATFPKTPKDMSALECEDDNPAPAKATIEVWE